MPRSKYATEYYMDAVVVSTGYKPVAHISRD